MNSGSVGGSIGLAGQVSSYKEPEKGTAVDSINASIGKLTSHALSLTSFATRIADGLLGVAPEKSSDAARGGPIPVSQSTQDYIRDLEFAMQRLSDQINRLG